MSETPSTFASKSHAYTVVRELGRGGQGRTMLVERESEPGSRYVLKLLRLEHVDDWKQVELFEREVATLAALDHPGIPRLVDRIEDDGRTAGIVQTFVEGHTLAEQIATHGPLGAARFERILRECLDILAHLHEQVPPVLHRDIKTRNVMLGPDRTYLIYFCAVRVGGKTDMPSIGLRGEPREVTGTVRVITDGRYRNEGPALRGVQMNMGRTVVLDTGRVEIVVISKQQEPNDLACLKSVGIDPARKRLLMLKSRVHYGAGFAGLAKAIIECAGSGVCTSDYSTLRFRKVPRPIYPLDAM